MVGEKEMQLSIFGRAPLNASALQQHPASKRAAVALRLSPAVTKSLLVPRPNPLKKKQQRIEYGQASLLRHSARNAMLSPTQGPLRTGGA